MSDGDRGGCCRGDQRAHIGAGRRDHHQRAEEQGERRHAQLTAAVALGKHAGEEQAPTAEAAAARAGKGAGQDQQRVDRRESERDRVDERDTFDASEQTLARDEGQHEQQVELNLEAERPIDLADVREPEEILHVDQVGGD